MAEDKKTFIQGKMNQDIDDRILPNGEYRSAQNIQVTTSEDSDVGSIQNILGNKVVNNSILKIYDNIETIGCFFDEKNNRIFYFVTNYTCANSGLTGLVGGDNGPTTAEQHFLSTGDNLFCGIFMVTNADSVNLPSVPTLLVQGLFLNFSKTHLITGVNLIDDLLFFTDGLNQPRRINIKIAADNQPNLQQNESGHYNTEDKISVAKFAPFMPPLLLEHETTTLNNNTQPTTTDDNGNITNIDPTASMELSTQNDFPEDFLREKFVRFSYRYRFIDGEYSTIAPFTQICFIPKTTSYNITQLQKVFKKGELYFQDTNGIADGMVNNVTAVNLNIILPSKKISTDFDINAIEILYKESDNNLIRAIELKDLSDDSSSSGVFQYKYKSTLPYKTLPKDQLTRVYDNVPLSAKAQEIISNRVVYGNYVENRKLPNQPNLAGLNFSVGLDVKYDTTNTFGNADFNNYYLHKEYPFHSIKQRRTYEVGVVLSDRFGRQSPVLTSTSSLSSINVSAKNNLFHSSSWDTGSSENINSPGGVVSNNSPGNENYCGDALTITFNEAIPNAYAKSTLIPINEEATSTSAYVNNLFKTSFATDPNLQGGGQSGIGVLLGTLYYYASSFIPEIGVTDFIYTDATVQTPLTGQSVVYINTGFSITSTSTSLHEIILNPTTGAVESINIITVSIFQSNLLGAQTPALVANIGDLITTTTANMAVTPIQEPQLSNDYSLGPNSFLLTISNFSQTDAFSVGDYLKGQDSDFVEIIFIDQDVAGGLTFIFTNGPASLSYKNYTGTSDAPVFDPEEVLKYAFFKYKLTPHGWYSYRVVVKQTEQEYNNVYTPGAISFDNDKDENKTYIPIAADSINKITRDIEFTNTQEQGLSTSKNRVYPKVIPDGDALSKQSDADLLDVISIGTAKEQGLKNDNNDVFDFVYESSKNTLIAQLPYGDDDNFIGTSVDGGFAGSEQVVASTVGSGDIKLKNQGKTLTWTDSNTNTYPTSFKEGNYLKGKFKDLVKIIEFTGPVGNVYSVTCDGAIDDVALGLDKEDSNAGVAASDLPSSIKVRFYDYKYGIQDKISVFETKPFESVLDIYYETSTAGLIHELNEAVNIPTNVQDVELVDVNFKESVKFFDDSGNSLNQKIGRLKITDQFDNELTFGTAPSQLITCVIVSQQGIMINGDVVTDIDRFETIANVDTGFFELFPKTSSGGNFVYYPEEFPVSYNLEVEITNNNGETATRFIDNLQLENVIPNTSATPNNFVTLGSQNELVFEFIDETNGSSAGIEHNQKGLFYQDANLIQDFTAPNETVTFGFDQNFEVSFDVNEIIGQSITLPARETLRDSATGILRPEVRIDNNTGNIFTTELYTGTFQAELEINIIDSDDEGLKNLGDPEVGGKQHVHILDLAVNDGLIVIDTIEQTQNTGFVTDVDGNTVDIFNQGASSFSGTLGFYNSYFSQFITDRQREKGMFEIPAFGENGAGVFLFSTARQRLASNQNPDGGFNDFKAFALKNVNNQPVVIQYSKSEPNNLFQQSGIGGGRRLYLNHWLAPSETSEDTNVQEVLGEITGNDARTPGGYIFVSPSSFGDDPFGGSSNDLNSKTDIDGGNDTNTRLNPINEVDSDSNFWDADGFFPSNDFGNAPDTEGYFKVYGDQPDEIAAGVAKPEDRPGGFNEEDTFIYKAQDTFTIGNVDYNILYEISSPTGYSGFNYQPETLKRVILCRTTS
ncbi:hypothetical protein [Marinobacter sp.]|uniref:hypothetical protein n=1 Tax=Marinobacter sp. TaxID=50741 RepID=UPI00257B896A|nr:hypothetical protein [Marinobacter sp.]